MGGKRTLKVWFNAFGKEVQQKKPFLGHGKIMLDGRSESVQLIIRAECACHLFIGRGAMLERDEKLDDPVESSSQGFLLAIALGVGLWGISAALIFALFF